MTDKELAQKGYNDARRGDSGSSLKEIGMMGLLLVNPVVAIGVAVVESFVSTPDNSGSSAYQTGYNAGTADRNKELEDSAREGYGN